MEPEQIKMVQDSFEQFYPRADAISLRFYDHLFRIDPSQRALFRSDLPSQSRKFMAMIRVTVKGLSKFNQIRPVIQDLGKRHVLYGVNARQYLPMRDALMEAFRDELGEGFTPELEQAWIEAYDLLAGVMLEAESTPRTTSSS